MVSVPVDAVAGAAESDDGAAVSAAGAVASAAGAASVVFAGSSREEHATRLIAPRAHAARRTATERDAINLTPDACEAGIIASTEPRPEAVQPLHECARIRELRAFGE